MLSLVIGDLHLRSLPDPSSHVKQLYDMIMVFTAAQMTAFLRMQPKQATVIQLQQEGIQSPDDNHQC